MRNVLQTGCLILGILCLFYFTVIAVYAGISEWFPFAWVAAGIGFLILWRMLIYQESHPDSPVRFLTGAALIMMAAAIAHILVIGSRVVGGMTAGVQKQLDCVIVLGAQVRGTQPSRALRKRLDRALEYAQENPDTIFILSGGKGPDEGISEAQCMYNYMEEKGMDTSRLILEDRSTSTQENLQFSAVFLDKENERIGILSNNFHIYRALTLAEKAGYQTVCGIPAPSDPAMQPHYVLREICALAVMLVKG